MIMKKNYSPHPTTVSGASRRMSIRAGLFWACVCLLVSPSLFAQSRITGKVTDQQGGPLPGVTVQVVGTQSGTTTIQDGSYALNAAADAVLRFSFLGYVTQDVSVAGRAVVNVTLAEDTQELDEVVVIGYGTVRKRDLTGATASVSGSQLATVPVTTAAQAITGKLAGVNVVTRSGAPGASVDITVRGGTSITQSTSPLYIVDGFQMDDGLKYVDINDIETIDVMKDASATAIYGARGSNGVILITTKSGKAGKTQVSYNGYVSFEQLGKNLSMLNPEEYVKYQYEYMMLNGKNMAAFDKYFVEGDVSRAGMAQYISSKYGNDAGIDWQDLVFGGTAMLHNHNVSIMGGTDKTKFILSYNYTNQDGIVDKYGYQKNNIRAKIDHQIRDWVSVDFSTNFNSATQKGGTSLGARMRGAIQQTPTTGVFFTRDELINTEKAYDNFLTDEGEYNVSNPILLNRAITQSSHTRQYSVNAGLNIDILENLTWRTAGSYFWQQVRSDYWEDGTTVDAIAKFNGKPHGYRNNGEKFTYQITNTLTWAQQFGRHRLNAVLGQETTASETLKLDNTYDGFEDVNFGLNSLKGAQSYSYESDKTLYRSVSVFGRVMYNYDDRYLFTATLRGDGVSKFARGNQWGYLPSASAAWRISEENFMKNQNIFDQLKLRVGYGTTGNCNIDDYMYSSDYNSGIYIINNTEMATLIPGTALANPGLKWEKTTSTNIGLDVTVLRGRINLSVDWYNQLSDNLLMKVNVPKHTGYDTQFQNVGSIRNRGWEFVLNTRNISNSNFTWTTDFNISFNRSKVIELYGNEDITRMTPSTFLIEKGKPMGQFYGYFYDGLYTTDDFTQNGDSYTLKDGVARQKGKSVTDIKPGDIKYVPIAGEVDASGNPVWSTEDRTVIGNALPKFTGGMVNTFTYKGFDLSVFMNFSYGNKVMNQTKQGYMGPRMTFTNTIGDMADRFVMIDPSTGYEATSLTTLAALNPNQNDPHALWSASLRNKGGFDDQTNYFLEDGSFLRIGTITLGYTLPSAWAKKISLGSARVYTTLNNAFLFTDYTGYDPEVANSDGRQGIDSSNYPRAKSFVIGLNITF